MSEEKKNKRGNKITAFPVGTDQIEDPEMDEFLRESVMQEADELEEKLNNDPALRGVGASDDLFLSIVGKLKEQGVWEEEEEKEKENESAPMAETGEAENKDTKVYPDSEHEVTAGAAEPENLEKLYQMLPEEDRKALELGRQVREDEQKKAAKQKKRWKVLRHGSVVAAMLVLVCGIGMSTEANRKVVLNAWNTMMTAVGFWKQTDYVDPEFTARSVSKEEQDAMNTISETLEIPGIEFIYLPEGMSFLSYVCEPNLESKLFYSYQDKIISVKLKNIDQEGVTYNVVDSDAKNIESIEINQYAKAQIWESNLDLPDEQHLFTAEFAYENAQYEINGMIPLEELKKILKFLIFL